MKSTEEYLKENRKLADFERAVFLNDLQSIYIIVEDFVDSEVKNCSTTNVRESSKLTKAKEERDQYRNLWQKSQKLKRELIKKYNLPIADATLD